MLKEVRVLKMRTCGCCILSGSVGAKAEHPVSWVSRQEEGSTGRSTGAALTGGGGAHAWGQQVRLCCPRPATLVPLPKLSLLQTPARVHAPPAQVSTHLVAVHAPVAVPAVLPRLVLGAGAGGRDEQQGAVWVRRRGVKRRRGVGAGREGSRGAKVKKLGLRVTTAWVSRHVASDAWRATRGWQGMDTVRARQNPVYPGPYGYAM